MTERWQLAPERLILQFSGLRNALFYKFGEFWNALFYKFCGPGSVLSGVG